jgi:hypothetical protein
MREGAWATRAPQRLAAAAAAAAASTRGRQHALAEQ